MTLAIVCVPAFGQTTTKDRIHKGVEFYGQEKYEEAIQAFDRAAETNPQYADAWSRKGIVLNQLGRYDEAIKAFDKAIEINPQSAKDWIDKGDALYG
jgi:tetratricopeptide (TPR) repeat protein